MANAYSFSHHHASVRSMTRVLLVSCYELGHQPFAIASPWAQLEEAGLEVHGIDASLDPVDDGSIARADLVAISVPMHTALRLGVAIARRTRRVNPSAHICLYGLYASLNAHELLGDIADSVVGGEFEAALVELAGKIARGDALNARGSIDVLQRLPFVRPRRDRLPPLGRYAHLIGPEPDEVRQVGYAEASRGCLHQCLHCPITPVYHGRFFVVPRDIVLSDIEQQIAAGARHITFGDPDFFNGVGHSMAIAHALHAAHPEVTFDITVKVEHILKHKGRLVELAHLGCIFLISAIESLSDGVLEELEKGHTRVDALEAVRITREAGIALRPSFVAFTPWTTMGDFIELCDFVLRDLVDHVDPIQLVVRLLIPPGSAILRHDRPRPWLRALEPEAFGYRWEHPDPRMDALYAQVIAIVEEATRRKSDAAATIEAIRRAAYETAGLALPRGATDRRARRFVPKLSEPWFCCAEPNLTQVNQVG
jgi:radical SAM superfamily enzyme YgiQ (UPF0313 family)